MKIIEDEQKIAGLLGLKEEYLFYFKNVNVIGVLLLLFTILLVSGGLCLLSHPNIRNSPLWGIISIAYPMTIFIISGIFVYFRYRIPIIRKKRGYVWYTNGNGNWIYASILAPFIFYILSFCFYNVFFFGFIGFGVLGVLTTLVILYEIKHEPAKLTIGRECLVSVEELERKMKDYLYSNVNCNNLQFDFSIFELKIFVRCYGKSVKLGISNIQFHNAYKAKEIKNIFDSLCKK